MTMRPLSSTRSIHRWIRWLILPLALGTATIALITQSDRQQLDVAIAVTFINLDDDLLIAENPRQSVKLLISGTPSALASLDPKNTACYLDLGPFTAGTHAIPVTPEDINLPKTVRLTDILTPSLTIRLEPLVRQSVSVIAVLEGEPAPGYAVAKVKLKPDQIVLKGTARMLAGIDTVKTRPINLEAASESFKKEVALDIPETIAVDSPLRIVLANVIVKERIVTRVLEDIPIVTKGSSIPHRMHTPTITLTVSGPEAVVNTIEDDPAFGVTVNLNGLAEGTHSLTATINLPVRASLVRVAPERFAVTIDNNH